MACKPDRQATRPQGGALALPALAGVIQLRFLTASASFEKASVVAQNHFDACIRVAEINESWQRLDQPTNLKQQTPGDSRPRE
jgi:hypothetical protein